MIPFVLLNLYLKKDRTVHKCINQKCKEKYINAVEEILAIGQREDFLIMHNL